jgi:hypothetical protein
MPASLSSPRSWTGSPVFYLVAILSALAAAAAWFVAACRHIGNPRVEYGLLHLPAAFLQIAIFAAALGVAYRWYLQGSQRSLSSRVLLSAVVVLFAAVWLPVALHGGFAQDDWMLLSASSVRKFLYTHPLASLNTLDTVDGNYRPLGTVLYVGYLLRWFGLHPLPFALGSFFAGLACTLLVFALMRELRQGSGVSAAAAILFLSRDLIYVPIAWMCALGDTLAIFGSGLCILLLLRALRTKGVAPWLYHVAAWLCFVAALLSKQSAFAVPMIAVLAILLVPATTGSVENWKKRLPLAITIGAVYGATVLVVFRHAVNLLAHKTPYPIKFSPLVLRVALSHITWFFLPLDFPDAHPYARLLVPLLGLIILVTVVLWLRRSPYLLGTNRRLMVFLLGSAFASLSLFLLLPSRSAAYYGSMAAFWLSMAVAIVLKNLNERACVSFPHLGTWGMCLLLLCGYSFVRLKQTGLPPSGGYIWGTYSMDENMGEFAFLSDALKRTPHTKVLVIVGGPYTGRQQANMAILADPSLQRILGFDPQSGFKANDRQGLLPQDNFGNLTDVDAYHWTLPMDTATASALLADSPALWIRMDQGKNNILSREEVQRLEYSIPDAF